MRGTPHSTPQTYSKLLSSRGDQHSNILSLQYKYHWLAFLPTLCFYIISGIYGILFSRLSKRSNARRIICTDEICSPKHGESVRARGSKLTGVEKNNRVSTGGISVKIQFFESSFSVRSKKPIKMHHIYEITRRKMNLAKHDFLSFFDENGTSLYATDTIESSQSLKCLLENKFGGDDFSGTNNIENDVYQCTSLDKDSFSITFSNVSGGLRNRFGFEKRKSIQANTTKDSVLILNECNCVESDASFLASKFGKMATVSACSDFTYRNGMRVPLAAGKRKLSGFGTAIISKFSETFEPLPLDHDGVPYEIACGILNLGGLRGLVIGAYRSPSMTDSDEIDGFYKAISDVLTKHWDASLAFKLVCMDDNKTISKVQAVQERWLIQKHKMRNMIGHQVTRLRSNTQPDSILCSFNPLLCNVRASVISPLGSKMDHNAIRIKIISSHIKPRIPTYRNITRLVRVKTDELIGEELNRLCNLFLVQNKDRYGRLVEMTEKEKDNVTDEITKNLYNIIAETKKFGWKKKIVRLPDCIADSDDKWTVKIGMEHARMEKLGFILQSDPKNKEALAKFEHAQERCLEFMAEKRDADCDLDLKHNNGEHGAVKIRNFYRWCDKFVNNKSSYMKNCSTVLTQAQKIDKLKTHDATFVSKDPDFHCEMAQKLNIIPDRTFDLSSWRPSKSNDKLAKFIKSRRKIDKFFKVHAEIIAEPLYMLLHTIQVSNYFPKQMRTSKATFIPGRTIFSLDTLTKIVEGVLGCTLTDCTEADFKVNGDPDGFAYRKNRGVISCMAITLSSIEKAPKEDGYSPVIKVADLKKAYNVTKRSTVVAEAQRIAGAGRLIMTRWKDRTYTFEGQVRGHEYNRGTDAGAILAVWSFDRWISTDRSCQKRALPDGRNSVILETCNFSDDRNPSAKGSDVQNGRFQNEVVDGMEHWAMDEDAEFHLTGPKEPGLMIFTQLLADGSSSKIPTNIADIRFFNSPIKITSRQKILGLTVTTEPFLFSQGNNSSLFKTKKNEEIFTIQAREMINKYGYFLDPDLSFMVNCAYRYHQLRDEITPSKMKTIISAYFLGKLRFAISMHFLRCTQKQIDTMRFYYGMAMSAILDVSAYETLGASCCFNRTVSDSHEPFKQLCKIVGLPTLKDLAIKDAKSCIEQIFIARKEWFKPNNARQWDKEIMRYELQKEKSEKFYPKYLNPERKGTLVEDLWNLANMKYDLILHDDLGDAVPEHTTYVANNVYRRNWLLAMEASKAEYRTGIQSRARQIYRVKSLHDIEALERNDRRLKRRTPTKPLVASRTCRVYPPDVDGRSDYTKEISLDRYEFSCSHLTPTMHLEADIDESAILCRACGDIIKSKNLKKSLDCTSCSQKIHHTCAKKLAIRKNFQCCDIKKRIVPIELGKLRTREIEPLSPKIVPGKDRCLICGDVKINENVVFCRTNCGFFVHHACCKALENVQKTLSIAPLKSGSWECNEISHWIGPEAVPDILETSLTLTRVRQLIRLCHIERVIVHRDTRKRRYDNPADDLICPHCSEIVPLEQRDHLWSHCVALKSSPVSKDRFEATHRVKRRCIEIASAMNTVTKTQNCISPNQNFVSDSNITYRQALMTRTPPRSRIRLSPSCRTAESVNTQMPAQNNRKTVSQVPETPKRRRNMRPNRNLESRIVATPTSPQPSIILANQFSVLTVESTDDRSVFRASAQNDSEGAPPPRSKRICLRQNDMPVSSRLRSRNRNNQPDAPRRSSNSSSTRRNPESPRIRYSAISNTRTSQTTQSTQFTRHIPTSFHRTLPNNVETLQIVRGNSQTIGENAASAIRHSRSRPGTGAPGQPALQNPEFSGGM